MAVLLYVLVDASASMRLETPARYATAARVAAAMIAAAVAGQNSICLMIADRNATRTPRALIGRRGLVKAMAEFAVERPAARSLEYLP